ncbi:MAG: hypothetical protein DRN27_10010 [Thermoplasmata archaeon]|nr:MAG: hypothetical protein DRN27_10010 [Thermoplasmata archaeon]
MKFDDVWVECREAIHSYKIHGALIAPDMFYSVTFYNDLEGCISIGGWILYDDVWVKVLFSLTKDDEEIKYIDGILSHNWEK